MDFILIDPSGQKFQFPVNPEEVKITREKSLETVNILSLGEIDFAHGEKIREVSFSSFFPKVYDSSYCKYPNIPDPQQAMQQLSSFMSSTKPLRLIIAPTEVNVLVFVSAHSSTFKGGEPGDVYFDLTCRTWREVKVRTSAEQAGDQKQQAASIGSIGRSDTKPVTKLYKVKSGDSLSKIAKLELGNSAKYKDIYEKNRKLIGPDPNLIQIGWELVLS